MLLYRPWVDSDVVSTSIEGDGPVIGYVEVYFDLKAAWELKIVFGQPILDTDVVSFEPSSVDSNIV